MLPWITLIFNGLYSFLDVHSNKLFGTVVYLHLMDHCLLFVLPDLLNIESNFIFSGEEL